MDDKKMQHTMEITQAMLQEKYVTVKQAAEILKISEARVKQLCQAERFNGAVKFGWSWMIPRESVENHKPRPRGRQPKPKREHGPRADGAAFM